MKKDKDKIQLIYLFWGLSISLAILATVHAQTVPAVPPAKPTPPFAIDSPKGLKKDSLTPKISQDLLNLYKAYQARKYEGSLDSRGDGASGQPPLPVADGFVTIDAIASHNAETLKTDMEALGLKNSASFGRVVSGLFPISEIPKLSGLKSLKFARASSAITHN